jgi:hypothetical protein
MATPPSLLELIQFHNQQPFVMMAHIDDSITRKRDLIDEENPPATLTKKYNKKYREMLLEYNWIINHDESSRLELFDILTARRTDNIKRKREDSSDVRKVQRRNQQIREKRINETDEERQQRLEYHKKYYHDVDKIERPEREAQNPTLYKSLKSQRNHKYYETHKHKQ